LNVLWGLISIKNGADYPSNQVNKGIFDDGSQGFISLQQANSIHNFFSINSTHTIMRAINECPQVSTILFRKAQAHSNGLTELTKENGKPLPVELNKTYKRLLLRPNIFENRTQFVSRLIQYLNSFGYAWEYHEIPLGFGVEQMSRKLLDPRFCRVTWKTNLSTLFVANKSDLIDSFYYKENGTTIKITDFENLYCYCNPNIPALGQGYLPESPLKTLENPINASIANYKHRIRAIGAGWGFVSPSASDSAGAISLTPSEKQALKDDWAEHGTGEGKSELAFASKPMAFTSVMPTMTAMKLLELLKSDSSTICDVMGYEFDLLGRDLGGVALNNKNEAGKNLYQNHIIPERKNIDEQEAECLQLDKLGLKLETSFKHLGVLQADKALEAQSRRFNVPAIIEQFKNNMIVYDEAMEQLESENLASEFTGKFWYELTPEQQAMFNNSKLNNNGTDNQNTDSGGNQDNQSGQGQNNQG